MRVFVDLGRCERHGLCAALAPAVFRLDEDGELRYDASPPEHLRDDVLDAVAGCPTGAISVDLSVDRSVDHGAAGQPDTGGAGVPR